jgi:hypothetical protein
MLTKTNRNQNCCNKSMNAHCHLADGAWIQCNRLDSKSFALNSSTNYEDGFALEGSVNLHLTHKNVKFLGRINHLQSLVVVFAWNEWVAKQVRSMGLHAKLHLLGWLPICSLNPVTLSMWELLSVGSLCLKNMGVCLWNWLLITTLHIANY